MSFWNFVGGAAEKLLKDREAAGAEERELEMWKKRAEFQAKIQADMEAAKEKNRIIAAGINTKTGTYEEQTLGGETRSVPLNATALEQAKAAEQAALDKAARDKAEFDFKKQVAEARTTAERNRAQASLDRVAIANRNAERLERETNAKIENGYFTKPDKKSEEEKTDERDVTAAYNTIDRNEELSDKVREAARKIRFSNTLSPAQKKAALLELFDVTDK